MKIYRCKNALRRHCFACTAGQILYAAAGGISIAACVYFCAKRGFSPVLFAFIPVIILCAALFLRCRKNKNIYRAGLAGEAATQKLLTRLGREYTLVVNPVIEYDGKKSEIDLVAVGRNGVFVIEVKNHKGTIRGASNEETLRQYKDNHPPVSFYNPVRQVATHTHRLKGVLRENGHSVFVRDMVYFSHPDTRVMVERSGGAPIFSAKAGGDKMLGFIKEYKAFTPLSRDEARKIAKLVYRSSR